MDDDSDDKTSSISLDKFVLRIGNLAMRLASKEIALNIQTERTY